MSKKTVDLWECDVCSAKEYEIEAERSGWMEFSVPKPGSMNDENIHIICSNCLDALVHEMKVKHF